MQLTASTVCFIPCILLFVGYTNAVSFPVIRRTLGHPSERDVDDTQSFGNGSTTILNQGDSSYDVKISLGGNVFTVSLDSGSSDLWVQGNVPSTNNPNKGSVTFNYALGEVSGPINTAELKIDGFTVSDQAYLKANSVKSISGDGVLGIGPSSGSQIRSQFGSQGGDPFLDRIFNQNTNTPNFFTMSLSRSQSAESSKALLDGEVGQLTIGQVIPQFKDITDTPKLTVIKDQFGAQHWGTLLDANGILGPDGQKINTTTRIPNPNSGTPSQLRVMFDSGFTNPQLPRDVVDALYGRVPGAKFIQQGSSVGLKGLINFWTIPCNYELNISFVFGNKELPMAPLDLTTKRQDNHKNDICIANFQQMADNLIQEKSFGALDIIFGMAFLRSNYLLVNVGDFIDGSSSSRGDPYIQLLSTIDKTLAHTDFVNSRLGGKDTTGSQPALVPQSQAQHSPADSAVTPSDDDGDDDDNNGPIYKKTWFIVSVACAGVAILCLFLGLVSRGRRRRSFVRTEAVFVPGRRAYAPLSGYAFNEPMRPANTAYQPAYMNGRYGDA